MGGGRKAIKHDTDYNVPQKQTNVDAHSDDVRHEIFLSGTDELQRMSARIS